MRHEQRRAVDRRERHYSDSIPQYFTLQLALNLSSMISAEPASTEFTKAPQLLPHGCWPSLHLSPNTTAKADIGSTRHFQPQRGKMGGIPLWFTFAIAQPATFVILGECSLGHRLLGNGEHRQLPPQESGSMGNNPLVCILS